MQDQINQLIQRVADLERWKEERMRQQIIFPLDINSIDVLNRYFMRITGDVTTIGGAALHEFTSYIGQQDDMVFQIGQITDIMYSVDPSTNVLTVINSYLRFFDDDTVTVATEDTAPDPLVPGDTYYVRDSDGTNFKLALTAGGAAINITDTGAGRQFIAYV
jgi:hypothetical protein